MGLLHERGYKFAESIHDADVCVFNSCTVKNPSQDSFVQLITKAAALNKPAVAAGCVPQADRKLAAFEKLSVVGVTQIDRIVDVLEETLKGNIVKLLAKKQLPSLDLPKIRKNKFVEIIPLSTGCLGSCTYCKTKHARGKLGSYRPESICDRIRCALSDGVNEIWFTSEDTGAYGLDINTNVADLLETSTQLLAEHEIQTGRRVMLRIGMTNPPFILDLISRLVEVFRHPNMFQFIHIPVQSGSTKTLTDMNREYSSESFVFLVESLRASLPRITIATDIICGFPTEDEDDHDCTLQMLSTYQFPVVNISQFYPRPGTPAAKMKRVPTQIVKRRSREVTSVFHSYSCFDWLVGDTRRVWFSENSLKSDHTVGHTKEYIKVLVDRADALLGCSRMCVITSATKWHVVATVTE
eukprot:CAMPEP_0113845078 /NCGR_PEP_ID=MMETSP0372-20130328/566_1 /TAXON_ID=340204 /ORGANISM="Lankesteria abbotti" /LENGTH=410 /DNA_ID=CAMNT_0000814099 /DNA_START=762 /DNA_END=1994 /DNA_ORIENTATION=- /assembly_acc=CAM_ASM_000359